MRVKPVKFGFLALRVEIPIFRDAGGFVFDEFIAPITSDTFRRDNLNCYIRRAVQVIFAQEVFAFTLNKQQIRFAPAPLGVQFHRGVRAKDESQIMPPDIAFKDKLHKANN